MSDIDVLIRLHTAIFTDQLQKVKHEIKILKDQNKSLDSKSATGQTSLLLACYTKNINSTNIIKLLIQEEANVNISDDLKLTPLHAACWNQELESAEILLRAGANVNAQTVEYASSKIPHETPLHLAVYQKNYKLINLLLDEGADANIQNNHKLIPLFCVERRQYGHFDQDTLERLISVTSMNKLKRVIPSSTCTLLHGAIETNNIKLVAILIKHGVVVHSSTRNHSNAIWLAASFGYVEIIKMIWKVINVEKCKKVDKFWPDLLRWVKHYSNKVVCLYYVMKISRLILDPQGVLFYSLVQCVNDSNILEVDMLGITKMLFDIGGVFFQKDLEGLIYLCSKYRRHNCTDREIELLNLFIENNVDINPSIIYFSVVNHPELTLTLLRYCIECDPIDIFKHGLKYKGKPDESLLNLIKDVLKLCSPNCGLRFKRFLHLQSIKNKGIPVRTTHSLYRNKINVPWYEYVLDSEIDNELCEEVLYLLYRSRVPLPTLVELSRNKIRQQLRVSCKGTKSYLQKLKSLQLPRSIVDIIQCKANIIK